MFKKQANQTSAKMSSIIGADMVIEGNIKAKDTVRIEGKVEGDVETDGALMISSTAAVKGNVRGCNVIVGGVLEGDLISGGKTEVLSTGKMIGNIHTKSLIVDENAVFQGQCVMNECGEVQASQPFKQVENVQIPEEPKQTEEAQMPEEPEQAEESRMSEELEQPEYMQTENAPTPEEEAKQDNNFRKINEKKK